MGIGYILLEFLVLQTVAWCVPLYSLYRWFSSFCVGLEKYTHCKRIIVFG